MKLVATREARQFLRAWRQAAIPTAFVAAVLSVPLLAGWRFLEQPEISGVRLLGAPLACVAVVPASYAWAAMVRKAPWLDSPGGFVIAAAGCALATLLGFVVASFLLLLVLWVLVAIPAVAFIHAYPGIVLGLVLPRIFVASLRPDRLRRALASS